MKRESKTRRSVTRDDDALNVVAQFATKRDKQNAFDAMRDNDINVTFVVYRATYDVQRAHETRTLQTCKSRLFDMFALRDDDNARAMQHTMTNAMNAYTRDETTFAQFVDAINDVINTYNATYKTRVDTFDAIAKNA